MNNVKTIKELVEKLNRASELYYNNGMSSLSDSEWDAMLRQLEKLEKETGIVLSNSPTKRVGATVLTKLNKIVHDYPILSLSKIHTVDKVKEFANKKECILMTKLDGMSVSITYENGKIVKAESRGDGEVGSDLSEHIKQFINVPKTIPVTNRVVLHGEALIKLDDFENINASEITGNCFKNSRNLTAGVLSGLDTGYVNKRKVRFYLWRVIECDDFINMSVADKLAMAADWGFDVVPFLYYDENRIEEQLKLIKAKSENLNLPCDGCVIAYNDEEYASKCSRTEKVFNHSIAFKYEDNRYATTLIDVEWNTTKTGVVFPVAILNPVEIEGSIVSRCTLHNLSIMKSFGLKRGCTCFIYKANMIIPALDSCLDDGNEDVVPITHCPTCNSPLVIERSNDTENLKCTNEDCQGKFQKKLEALVGKKALDIQGLSGKTIEFLMDKGWVTTYADLFKLEDKKREWASCDGFGGKSVLKILGTIEESRNTTLRKLLAGLSIAGVGTTQSKAIDMECKGDWNTFIEHIQMYGSCAFTHLAGIGDVLGDAINNWYKTRYETEKIEELVACLNIGGVDKEESETTGTSLDGKVFVITGSLTHFSNRAELVKKIESLGGKVSGSVSAKTNYLINNDNTSNSSKNQKAKQLGIDIITEVDFLGMIA